MPIVDKSVKYNFGWDPWDSYDILFSSCRLTCISSYLPVLLENKFLINNAEHKLQSMILGYQMYTFHALCLRFFGNHRQYSNVKLVFCRMFAFQ